MPEPTDRLAEIQTRELVATKGPWGLYDSNDDFIDIAADLRENGTGYSCRRSIAQLEADRIDNDPAHRDWTKDEEDEQVRADAEFIANARTDVPWLIEQLRQKDADNKELRAKLATAERQLERLDGELVRLRDDNRDYEKCFAPDGRAA